MAVTHGSYTWQLLTNFLEELRQRFTLLSHPHLQPVDSEGGRGGRGCGHELGPPPAHGGAKEVDLATTIGCQNLQTEGRRLAAGGGGPWQLGHWQMVLCQLSNRPAAIHSRTALTFDPRLSVLLMAKSGVWRVPYRLSVAVTAEGWGAFRCPTQKYPVWYTMM